MLPCCFKYLKVLVDSEDGSGVLRMDYKGLIFSYLLSVGNDTRWVPVISTAAKTCFDHFDGANEGYSCEGS